MEVCDIDNILYSAIRNRTHERVRNKGYITKVIKLLFKISLAKKTAISKTGRPGILTFAPEIFFDWKKLNSHYHVIRTKHRNEDKQMMYLEILLILSFFVRARFIQRFFFNKCRAVVINYAKRHNLTCFICCHPDLLSACIGYFFRRMDKRVITIQHGIYQLSSYQVLWFEKHVATDILVWGTRYKKMYHEQGVDVNKLLSGAACLTFKQLKEPRSISSFDALKPAIIGQQLYKISSTVSQPYNAFISALIDFYTRNGLVIHYRPHPREDVNLSLTPENRARLKLLNKQIDQNHFIAEYNLFYSVNSTLLVEAFLNGQISFQMNIPIPDFSYDCFNNYASIPAVSLENIEDHLKIDSFLFQMDSDYLNLNSNFRQHNVKLLFPKEAV